MRLTSFNDQPVNIASGSLPFDVFGLGWDCRRKRSNFGRSVARFPYVPGDAKERDERCYEAYNIQVAGLEQRLRATGIKKIVIGVSGGLDSTQALIVCCRTMDRLGLPRQNVLAYTMPGFATEDKTKSNAWKLMKALGVNAEEIDIRPSASRCLGILAIRFAQGEPVHDVTFENVQAGERTSHLFRLANLHNGIVLGTGDLSELALGWNTYGVGDQMSHYSVNASVPKTLIQHLIRWEIDRTAKYPKKPMRSSIEILNTEISPELVPAAAGGIDPAERRHGRPVRACRIFICITSLRYGFRPSKVAFLALHAWGDKTQGQWPPGFPDARRGQYSLAEIKKWLRVFLYRFFTTSQFKRSAMPNAPKVGSGGSLSPRGDWRAPSDSRRQVWIEELERNVG